MGNVIATIIGWLLWTWAIVFGVGFFQMVRRYSRLSQPYPRSAPILAFGSIAVALIFLVFYEWNKLHLLWVWPAMYAVATAAGVGRLGFLGHLLGWVAEPFHRLFMAGTGYAEDASRPTTSICDLIESRAERALQEADDYIDSVSIRLEAMYQLALGTNNRAHPLRHELGISGLSGLPDQDSLHDAMIAWLEPSEQDRPELSTTWCRLWGTGCRFRALRRFSL